MAFKKKVPNGFDSPTLQPINLEQGQLWQEANRNWWQDHPMRYDWGDGITYQEFSKEFFYEIDRRFFSLVREYMPWKKIPFDPIVDFDSLNDKDVLEIGVGSGSHAQLFAQHARTFTGIDITEYAIKSTSERMNLCGLKANIVQMDAENLEFDDKSFDFMWTWGVIHHSSNTEKILGEMRRVLRDGGTAIAMVYHRNIWNYYLVGFFYGLLRGDLIRLRSIHKVIQNVTDGGMARFYSIDEWRRVAGKYFRVDDIKIFGQKNEIIPLPGGKFKDSISKGIPGSVGRFITNRLKMGTFLVSYLTKDNS